MDVIDLRLTDATDFEAMAAGVPSADFYFYWIFKTGDASEIYSVAALLKKRFPNSIHAAGGTHVDKTADEAVSYLDSIVIGPGEKAFVDIIKDELQGVRQEYIRLITKKYHFLTLLFLSVLSYPESVINNKLFTGYADIPATLTYFSRGCVYKCAFAHTTSPIIYR